MTYYLLTIFYLLTTVSVPQAVNPKLKGIFVLKRTKTSKERKETGLRLSWMIHVPHKAHAGELDMGKGDYNTCRQLPAEQFVEYLCVG